MQRTKTCTYLSPLGMPANSRKLKVFILPIAVLLGISLLAPIVTAQAPIGGNSVSSGNSFSPFLSGHSNPASAVSPSYSGNSEPAPMGLADFGVGPSSTPYHYNTTSFLGTIQSNKLVTSNSLGGSGSSFQLNVNLNFTYGGTTYIYWVQNVVDVFTQSSGSNEQATFIDNIWNFSSSSITLQSTSLIGNGTLASSGGHIFYYHYATGLPGNNVSLSSPFTINLKVKSLYNSAGAPEVVMQYNDGYGWVTYDNINFSFAKGFPADHGFVVQGYQYTPASTFEDAELIMGGPGGGSDTSFNSGHLNLSLQYWNGHNYQFINNAYNFGADTAETSNNVALAIGESVSNATISSYMTPGSGSLGMLYSQNSMSSINVTVPYKSGTVSANNATYAFENGGFNLTLFPGTYNISVTPSLIGEKLQSRLTLVAGNNYNVNGSSWGKPYDVNLTAIGLPSGASWNITFANGTVYSSNNSLLQLSLPNGTYNVSVNTSEHYVFLGKYMKLVVNGANVDKQVNFTELYKIQFTESGLPHIMWFFSFDDQNFSQVASKASIYVINGSYSYSVGHLDGYTSSPSSGSVNVNGSALNISITFKPVLYNITITAKGLPQGYNWSVSVDGKTFTSFNNTIVIQLPNGSYVFQTTAGNGTYSVSSSNNTIIVAGSQKSLTLRFTNIYNSGGYLNEKLIYLAILSAIGISGGIIVRRR